MLLIWSFTLYDPLNFWPVWSMHYSVTGHGTQMILILEVGIPGPKLWCPKTDLSWIITNKITIFSKNSDQYLSFEGLHILLQLEVGFWAPNMVIFAKLQISPILHYISGSQDQAENWFFFQTAQKLTSSFPTKIFDPSKERSHSMAIAILKKSEAIVKNTTAVSKYIPRRPRISIN